MINIDFNNGIGKITFALALIILFLPGCKKDFFEVNPQDQLSEGTFWKSKDDAYTVLMGCYKREEGWTESIRDLDVSLIFFDEWTDISSAKELGLGFPQSGILPTTGQIGDMWSCNYKKIARANYFLDNIGKVNMDEGEKKEMIAEAKFIRDYSYFWLCQLWGNVPFPTKTLTFDEANKISQTSKEEVVDFILNELTEIASDLPLKQPDSEKGRVEKGTALALKGRLLMAEKRWSEAAQTYKTIMDLNRYIIDPRFKELFQEQGDNSDEIIFAAHHMQDKLGDEVTQHHILPGEFGGYNSTNLNQNFVDKFLMKDGKSIEESPLYDPEHPYENRDPRIYATVLLPNYSIVNGITFQGHPDSVTMVYGQGGIGITGYGINKFFDHDYKGNVWSYGGDYKLIRYAEVLMSYLESKLEAGDNITQNLLDETINKIRGREAVDLPPVTETDPTKLREIIRNERCVEFAFEGGIRYWDLIRWGIAVEVISKKFYGMKITDNPETYSGSYIINDKGNIFVWENVFHDYNYLWPIPQSEMDINKNLVQNPGY